MKKKRFVKIIAVDNRYKDTPFPFVAIYNDDIATYMTGQHIDPSDPSTAENLTVKEMTGEIPLSVEKMKKFPYIINPNNEYAIINGMMLNVTKKEDETFENPKDGAIANMLSNYGYRIAGSRKKFKKGYDFFYIKDEIEESKEEVNIENKVYQAMKLIKENTNVSEYGDIALLLSYYVKGFFINVENKDEVVIQSRLFEQCRKNPDSVIACFSNQAKKELVVLKLAKNGIIKKKGNDFYDGERYIGNTIKSVLLFMNDPSNRMITEKWNRLLNKEDNVPSAEELAIAKELAKNEKRESLKSLSLEELRSECAKLRVFHGHYKKEEDKSKLIEIIVEKI